MTRRLGIEVRAVDSAREAVRGADILSSCTDSMTPVYDAAWIEPGMHVTNLGRREMPEAAMDRFDVIVRQGTAGLQMRQTERFQAERGLSPAAFIGGTPEEMKRLPETQRAARHRRRQSRVRAIAAAAATSPISPTSCPASARAAPAATRCTFYRNVGNQGLQFSAVGGWVYEQAVKRKMGREIPTEWFLQNIRD